MGRWVWLVVAAACAGGNTPGTGDGSGASEPTADTATAPRVATGATGMTGLWALTGCTGAPEVEPNALADVEAVTMTGGPDRWTVSVTVRSPDVDCDQYADWWEVLTSDGELVYRRILNHSHPDEQPFTRGSEGAISLDPAATYRVRAHLHPFGYGGQVMEGAPGGAFAAVEVPEGWAADLAAADPLPADCWY